MIGETVLELRQKGFSEDEEEASKMRWIPIQFWKVAQTLSGEEDEVCLFIYLLQNINIYIDIDLFYIIYFILFYFIILIIIMYMYIYI